MTEPSAEVSTSTMQPSQPRPRRRLSRGATKPAASEPAEGNGAQEAAEGASEPEPAAAAPKKTSRKKRSSAGSKKPKEITDTDLAALGRVTLEAHSRGLSPEEFVAECAEIVEVGHRAMGSK